MSEENKNSIEVGTQPLPPVSTVSSPDDKTLQAPGAAIKSEEEAENAEKAIKDATTFGRAAVFGAFAGATSKISHDVAGTLESIIESKNPRLKEFRIVMEVFLRPVWLLAKALEMISGAGEQKANGMQVKAADTIKNLTGDTRLIEALGKENSGKPAGEATKEKPKTSPSKMVDSGAIQERKRAESLAAYKAADSDGEKNESLGR